MRTCGFCGIPLGGSGAEAAKEHVLRNSWLKTLGIKKTVLQIRPTYAKGGEGKIRTFAADSLQVGEVCKPCNNGWMNALDLDVEDAVLAMANGVSPLSFNSEVKRFQLARWLLKTACTFVLSMEPHRRTIPIEIYRSVSGSRYLPRGFFAYAAALTVTDPNAPLSLFEGAEAGTCNYFWVRPEPGMTKLVNARVTKFGVRYKKIVLGCALPGGPCEAPCYTGAPGFHWPIWTEQATFTYRGPERCWPEGAIPFGTSDNGTNTAACLLDIEL